MTMVAMTRISLKEILVADDLTEVSAKAIGYAKAIAKRFDSHLLVAHVSADTNPITSPESEWFEDHNVVRMSQERLAGRGAELRAEGFHADTVDVTGIVNDQIPLLARRYGSELLIFGTHAHHGWERLLFGSKEEVVAQNAGLSVMGLGPKARSAPQGAWQPQNILCVATPNSECEAALIYACRLADGLGVKMTLISPKADDGVGSRWEEFELELARKYPEAHLCDALPHRTAAPELIIQSVLQDANSLPADFIVMSATPGPPFAEHFRRGPLAHLLADAPCPVISVPAK